MHTYLIMDLQALITFAYPTHIIYFQVFPVIELADRKVQADKILPDFIKFNWTYYDDKCDSALATINVIDAYKERCSHFIIGPSCDYSVGK